MRNFKKNIYPVLFLAVIICMNQILILALKPCTNFRNDIHKLETNQYDDLFVGTSHGKAGINPEVVDKITGERSLNLCLGGEEVQDSYYIIKEACRVNKPKKIIYELDPGYWVSTATLGPEFRTIYDELPLSSVKVEYYVDKIWKTDFRTTLFPWYLYRKESKGLKRDLYLNLARHTEITMISSTIRIYRLIQRRDRSVFTKMICRKMKII